MNDTGSLFLKKYAVNVAWGTWETLAFYKRNGYGESFPNTPEWADIWIEKLSGEETVRKMADAGINLIISRYFKGFGLKAEEPDLKFVRQ